MPAADPIAAAAGGNVSPTTPFLLGAVAGGNLGPANPGLTVAAPVAVAATAVLLNAGEHVIGDIFGIGALEYTFVAVPAVVGDVKGEASYTDILAAINGTDGINPPHPLFRATFAGGDVVVTAVIPGSAGNGIAVYWDGSSSPSWATEATQGGSDAWPVSGTPGGSAAAAGGNLAPTAPAALTASGGTNLGPATPFLGTAAAAGNVSPTAPGLTQAAAGGNLAPTAPGAIA